MPCKTMPCPDHLAPDHEACDVLLIDDSADALRLLDDALGEAGYHVHSTNSGESALQHLGAHLPGAILLDVMMPGMDGFETCERIRAISDEVPIIFMTGLGETEHVVRGFELGANDYVTKPLSMPEVIARVQAHTRTARLVRATRDAVRISPTALLAFDADGRILWANDAASALLPDASELSEAPVMLQALASGADAADLALKGKLIHAQRVSEAAQDITVVMLQAEQRAPGNWAPPQLTARESEVLLWVARGKTNRDIAEILGMSPRTVNKHLEHIFEKLGVETRTAAADAARKLKLA